MAQAVEVAAAVIERAEGSFLLARRPKGKVYAGWWEFPGGKVEPGELAEAALARELHEELGIDVRTAYPWITRRHVYEHATVLLRFYRVVAWEGEPRPREGQDIAWQRIEAPIVEPMLPANAPVLASLALPAEYAVTDAQTRGTARMLESIRARLEQGLRLIQVRDKDLPGRRDFADEVIRLAKPFGARVLANGGPIPGGDGIHFTSRQLMALNARPAGGLAAASCHTREELERAMQLELDFAVLGPVMPTASHEDAVPLGWERFGALARGASIPVYAIGGMRRQDLDTGRRSGAHGLAMISGAWSGVQR
ncbi:MAG: Nudix family hydrolase [Candidatus Parcubacteria bacterium]|nr:Nudix family hydrolase [Burkholderiales bacterium]